MENICDVWRCNWTLRTLFWVHGPLRRTHNNQVLRVCPNGRNYRIGVVLDGAPIATRHRFTINLINNVRYIHVLLGNRSEKRLGKGCFLMSSMAVPVDNDVNIVFDSGFYHLVDHGKLEVRRLCIGKLVVNCVLGAAIDVIISDTHDIAENIYLEIIHRP